MTAPRFEVVRSDATQPWHARFRAGNGRIVWTTETYARAQRAENAISVITGHFLGRTRSTDPHTTVRHLGRDVEVRYIDERVTSDA